MLSALVSNLRRLALLGVAMLLCVGLAACDGGKAKAAASISPEDMAIIQRQAEGFLEAKDRLPDLASLVNQQNWVFTRNLIHGPMQEVGREMSYINQRLLPSDRAEANRRADALKDALAELDEAARLQDANAMRNNYIKVASGFGAYSEVIPTAAQPAS